MRAPRVTPVVDGNRAFIEWSIAFECPEAERRSCTIALEEAMPQWMKSLRGVLESFPMRTEHAFDGR